MVEVGDVGRGLAQAADLDRLAERVEESVAEAVADVRVVDASGAAGFGGEVGELGRRGVGARRVVEAAAEPERAVLERLADDALHAGHGRGVGRRLVPAQRRDPDRRVPDERGDVQAAPVEPIEVAAHG